MNTKVLALIFMVVYCFLRIDAISSTKSEKDGAVETTKKPLTTVMAGKINSTTAVPGQYPNKSVNLKVFVGDVNFDISSGNHKNVSLRVNNTGEEEEINVFVDPVAIPN